MNRCDHLTIMPTLPERICTIHTRLAAPVRQSLAWEQGYYAFANQNDILKLSPDQWSSPILWNPMLTPPPNILANTIAI